jgi:hypothetical protein
MVPLDELSAGRGDCEIIFFLPGDCPSDVSKPVLYSKTPG